MYWTCSWLSDGYCTHVVFLDPKDGSPNATLVVLVVVVTSSLKIPKAFLICSGVQQNFADTFMLIFYIDLLSQIFKLIY